MSLDVARIRAEFPSLAITDSGRPRIYFDSPGGTQTPKAVIDRTVDCLVNCNANLGGPFVTSQAAGRLVDEAHAAMADLLGATSPAEIVFGQNMTTLTFHISRSIARNLEPGDEIIVTRMDHDANIAPWLLVARDRGCRVRWLDFDRGSFEFDPAELDHLLCERTRVVALNYASNATGTINDVTGMTAQVRARAPKAMVYVDAVQLAPHRLIDVQAIGCDFLVCSPYKFFGPHQGVLWGRADLLMSLSPYKVRPADDTLPSRFETGTLSHEGMAGTLGAVEYLAWVGKELAPQVPARPGESERRRMLRAAWQALEIHERGLTRRLIEGLQRLPGIKIQGITEPAAFDRRVPTVSFIHDRLAPAEMSAAFAREDIFVWDGHNYALEVITHLGLLESGGVLRVGLAHYNTPEEVDRLLDVLGQMIRRNSPAQE
ncbi:MAG TPA: cysteine desulfurase-like protein [Dongiaceae bacterium]|nr:cysteine desulfurase-like protein [Dongiaceae bacterium]